MALSVRPTPCMLRSFGVSTPTRLRSALLRSAYMRALMALPAWIEWREAARLEPWVLPHDEVDWPDVKRG